jgi:cell division protein ZapB
MALLCRAIIAAARVHELPQQFLVGRTEAAQLAAYEAVAFRSADRGCRGPQDIAQRLVCGHARSFLLSRLSARATRLSTTARCPAPVDRDQGRHYIVPKIAASRALRADVPRRKFTMAESRQETLDLAALESRVDDLIRTVDQLKTENSALRSQQDNLINERATLIEKTEQARTRIESMITRLRAMETRS